MLVHLLVGLPLYLAVLCLNTHDLRLMAGYIEDGLNTPDSETEGPSILSMLVAILVSTSSFAEEFSAPLS